MGPQKNCGSKPKIVLLMLPLYVCASGYIQRRLIKAMEGLMVHYDGTIRNSNKQLLQLRYGEDGMDGAKMEFQVIPSIKPPDAKFEQHFKFDYHNSRCVSLANLSKLCKFS